jgi:hypothetical protein
MAHVLVWDIETIPDISGFAAARAPRIRAPRKCGSLVLFSETSSACASSVGGTVSPSILAVSVLMISSNLVGCSTRLSAGLHSAQILIDEFGAATIKVRKARSDIRPPATALLVGRWIRCIQCLKILRRERQ